MLTFILVNWNYGRYLGRMLDSIRSQTYPDFECIVVDNASSDDSRAVASRHTDGDPRFRNVFFEKNFGQLGATLRVADTIRGDYVCVADADDFLFPDYAHLHLLMHASAEPGVGVTSSNFIEVDSQSEMISGAGFRFPRPGAAAWPRPHRSVSSPSEDERAADLLDNRLNFRSKETDGWLWAQGTSNVYDRTCFDRACMIAPRDVPTNYTADGWFLEICHCIAGTLTIDIPLSAYRIHGNNAENGYRLLHWRSHSLTGQERSKVQRIDICLAILSNVDEVLTWGEVELLWRALKQIPYDPGLRGNLELQRKLTERIDVIASRSDDDEIVEGLAELLSLGRALAVIHGIKDRRRRYRLCGKAVSRAWTGGTDG